MRRVIGQTRVLNMFTLEGSARIKQRGPLQVAP